MKGIKTVIVVGFIFFLLLTGCTPPSSSSTEGKVSGPYKIEVQVKPDPALALKENEFQIKVKDEAGKPLEEAMVDITLSMADMDHGDLVFSCIDEGQGIYVGKGIPVMAGEWIATVHVEKNGTTSTMDYIFQASR